MVSKVVIIPITLEEGADFKDVYRKFGTKIQKNVPLTQLLLDAIEAQGGSDYLIKLAIRDLQEKKKLPSGYEILLDFP